MWLCTILLQLNLFADSTNSGKTLPGCLFPYLVEELKANLDLNLPANPKCLFLTPLNSIRDSLSKNMKSLGLDAEILTKSNAVEVLKSDTVKILFLSPELLNTQTIIQALLSVSKEFVIKVIDEVHLYLSWGIKKKRGKSFRPAMQLSTGELSSVGGITLLQTATASCKTVRILQEQFPEITSWKKITNVPFRSNVTLVVPPPHSISSKFQDVLEPFIMRMVNFGEVHLIVVRSITKGTEIYFHLLGRLSSLCDGKKSVAFYHR